jgi:hypothetical protein
MRTRLGSLLGLALTLVALLATAAGAEMRRSWQPAGSLSRPQPFTISGQSSGPIEGEIQVDGTSYRLARDARIYEVGRGFVPAGTSYYDRVLCISGMKWRNTLVVYNVLVRPAPDPAASMAQASPVGLHDDSQPR